MPDQVDLFDRATARALGVMDDASPQERLLAAMGRRP
jgi:hypothetical protein